MVEVIVDPAQALLDEVVRIRVTGLAPGQHVRVAARTEAFQAEAAAEYLADTAGSVDLSSTAPVSGTYSGCDPMGLFWSAELDDGADLIDVFHALARLTPLDCTITAEVDGLEVGRATLTRDAAHHGRAQEVRDGRIRGTFFARAGEEAGGGVIVVGGSDGGNNGEAAAALLAARGIPALSLAWFAFEDLPPQPRAIPLEYFEEAIAWLRARPEVAGGRIGVMGTSLGGELALLLGATFSDVAAVLAIVPSGVLWNAKWAHDGAPLVGLAGIESDPETPKLIQDTIEKGMPASATPVYLRCLEAAGALAADAEIPVERTRGPILMLSAEDDTMWPSTRLADIAVERLKACAFGFAFDHVSYPGAGHLAFLAPYVPMSRDWAVHPQMNIPVAVGGNTRDSAAAGADGWRRIIEFLRTHVVSAREERGEVVVGLHVKVAVTMSGPGDDLGVVDRRPVRTRASQPYHEASEVSLAEAEKLIARAGGRDQERHHRPPRLARRHDTGRPPRRRRRHRLQDLPAAFHAGRHYPVAPDVPRRRRATDHRRVVRRLRDARPADHGRRRRRRHRQPGRGHRQVDRCAVAEGPQARGNRQACAPPVGSQAPWSSVFEGWSPPTWLCSTAG